TKVLADQSVLILSVSKVKALDLERFVDRVSSYIQTEQHRKKLDAEGKSDLFHTMICPECNAVVDLSELDKSHYVYCRFCESVFTARDHSVTTQGHAYRVCEECHMYARVQGYTEFYFYF